MKKIRTFLLFSAAIIILFSGCSNMMSRTDDLSIDLSSVVSRGVGDYVKVWLVADGTNNFFNLPEAEAYQQIKSDGTISITNIPIGPDYLIYLSIGTETGGNFLAKETVNGIINVTGGTTTAVELEAAPIKTVLYSDLAGKSLKGAAYEGGKIFTVSADGESLYYGVPGSLTTQNAVNENWFRDVDEGIGEQIIVTRRAKDGTALGSFDGSEAVEFSFSSGLPAKLSGDIDMLSSFIFSDTGDAGDPNDDMQLGISQKNGGIVLSVYGYFDSTWKTEWMPVDFSEALASMEDLNIDLSGEFFKGFAVMKQGNDIWLYVASKIGNFRIITTLDSSGIADSGIAADGANIMDYLKDFVINHPDLKDRVILNLGNADNSYLYVGTDLGLYKLAATSDITKMATHKIFAPGERVELLETSSAYTACVTPLNLIIINNSTEAVAALSFNEGLPVDGLLSDGITGLNWDGSTLYIAGNYGFASLDVTGLF